MSRCNITVSPSAVCLLALFILLSSPVLLAAILLAALCHELGHYLVLHLLKGNVKEIHITAFGVEMKVKKRVNYAGEFLTTLAGPAVNLLLALLLSRLGRCAEVFYVFSGAQAMLGVFNLLPMQPLDGGTLLWTAAACLTEPYTADRVLSVAGFCTALVLTGFAGVLYVRVGGTPFLLLAAFALLWRGFRELGLVKRRQKR